MQTQEPVVFHTPVLEPPAPLTKWEREYRAFLSQLPELLKTHRGKYVAFHNERMVDTDTDPLALILRGHREHGYAPIHVEIVAEQPPVCRIPHYREYRPRVQA